MSYILDAIKKSESERGHGSIPGLQTVHSSSLNYKTDNKQIWPYILIGLLLLNFSGLIFYFISDANDESLTEANSNKSNSVQTLTNAEAIQPQHVPTQAINRSVPTAQASSQAIPDSITTESEIETLYSNNTRSNTTPTLSTNEIFDIEDLAENIKQNIPPMNFTGHVYSSSRIQRSIIINGGFMEEGDALNDNISLNEITSRGAVFNYQGTLFSVNVLTGWNVN